MIKMRKQQSGQSLLEMIFAIGILIIVVAAVLGLTIANITGQKESEFQIIANNLAREGIEVVRNIRDANWLAGIDWDAGLIDPAFNKAIAEFDSSTNSWQLTFDYADDDSLYTANGVYSHVSSGQLSIFHRFLTFKDICQASNGVETIETPQVPSCGSNQKIGLKVTAEVNWIERNRSHKVTLENLIYAWK